MNRIEYMLNILNAINNNDLNEGRRQLELINDSLLNLTQSLFDGNEELEYHRNELEGKFFRYGLANQSIINLTRGNSFNILSQPVVMADVFSITSITRMQIESFSMIFYLFFDEEPVDLLKFRYLIYQLHALQKQSNFESTSVFSHKKNQDIISEIEKIKNLIKKHNVYIEAGTKMQKEYLQPNKAKQKTTYDILVKTNLESKRIDELWNLYSNHAHSEHISDRQFNTIYKIRKSTVPECSFALTLNSILTTKLCEYLRKNFESVKNAFENLNLENKILIETFNSIGEKK